MTNTVSFELCSDGSVFSDGRRFRTLRVFVRRFRGLNVNLVPVVRESLVRVR